MSRFPSYDHLFLLMGANPLPNYVAAKLLTGKTGSIHLLYSQGDEKNTIPNTQQEAEFLKKVLDNDGLKTTTQHIHDSSGVEIETALVKTIWQEADIGPSQSVGLNYTGATKPMAVHTHRVLCQLSEGRCQCSYLDPRRMAFFFDDEPNPEKIRHDDISVSLETLAAMHGYEISSRNSPRKKPEFVDLLPKLLEIHKTSNGMEAWREWLKTEMTQFPDNPELASIHEAFLKICGDEEDTVKLAKELGKYKALKSYKKWFLSGWLEDVVLQAITDNANQFNLINYGAGINPEACKKRKEQYWKKRLQVPSFELDVAAMLGYQLFAISCIASEETGGNTKKHLFEVYVRARQLGGDEARIALVCLVGNSGALEKDIARDWHVKEQIKVFGRKDVMKLSEKLREWFCENSLYREGC